MILTLNTDIPDRKGNFYAKANDKVDLVTDFHYPVLIVKNNIQSFSVRVEYTNYEIKNTKNEKV
jgi:hypothetical protein